MFNMSFHFAAWMTFHKEDMSPSFSDYPNILSLQSPPLPQFQEKKLYIYNIFSEKKRYIVITRTRTPSIL
jgi:hypothetical protein